MSGVHPTWGHPIGQYYPSYTHQVLLRELHANMISAAQRANVLTMNQGMEAISLLTKIGKEEDSRKIKSMASRITLQTLRDALDMSWNKMCLAFLSEPEIMQACIKLMATVVPDGHNTPSPFSYEYGYLCFRIATISSGLCLVETMLDSAFKAAVVDLRNGRIHPLEILAEVVADFVKCDAQVSPTTKFTKVNERVLPAPSQDMLCLVDILWADRNLFLRTILQTYTPGLTGLMHALWQVWRIGRNLFASAADMAIGVRLYELLRRYHSGVTRDQDEALSALLSDTQSLQDLWLERSELPDAKDTKALIHGLVRRITTPNTWHRRPHIRSVLPILEFVVRLARPGAENVFFSLFAATILFLWGEIEDKQHISGDDTVNIAHIFHCFSKLLEIIPNTAHYAMQILVQSLVNSDLVCLVARLIALRRFTIDESDVERAKNHRLFNKVQTFFERLGEKIPEKILVENFTKDLDDWMRYRDYMRWCSEMMGSSEHNRRYCDAGWEAWREIPERLNQNAKASAISTQPIECSYSRCSHPTLMSEMRLA